MDPAKQEGQQQIPAGQQIPPGGGQKSGAVAPEQGEPPPFNYQYGGSSGSVADKKKKVVVPGFGGKFPVGGTGPFPVGGKMLPVAAYAPAMRPPGQHPGHPQQGRSVGGGPYQQQHPMGNQPLAYHYQQQHQQLAAGFYQQGGSAVVSGFYQQVGGYHGYQQHFPTLPPEERQQAVGGTAGLGQRSPRLSGAGAPGSQSVRKAKRDSFSENVSSGAPKKQSPEGDDKRKRRRLQGRDPAEPEVVLAAGVLIPAGGGNGGASGLPASPHRLQKIAQKQQQEKKKFLQERQRTLQMTFKQPQLVSAEQLKLQVKLQTAFQNHQGGWQQTTLPANSNHQVRGWIKAELERTDPIAGDSWMCMMDVEEVGIFFPHTHLV